MLDSPRDDVGDGDSALRAEVLCGSGLARVAYLGLLASHVVLSLSVVPLALTSFYFALTRAFARHRRLNRVFLPIWLYVSVTGVLIFFLLH